MTLRGLKVLRAVDWIAAEDTRRTRVLLQTFDIARPLIAHHAHNEHQEVPRLVARLRGGQHGALVTDAGMPGISDPGFLLLRECRAAGVPVEVLPGASAVITALVASGFPTEPQYLGFVPSTAGKRRTSIEALATRKRAPPLPSNRPIACGQPWRSAPNSSRIARSRSPAS
ncbi:MAG: ribosomal RNA small subunit methyltransferase I [Candidatus Eisenbacteria bacterium]